MSIWLIWTIWTSLSALPRKAVKFNYSLTLVVVTHTQGHGQNLRTQYIVKSVFSTVTFQINIAQMWVVYGRFVHRMIQTRMSRRKRWHLKSPRSQFPLPQGHTVVVFYIRASYWLPFMTIRPPIPEIQFDLENSRSKAKVKSTPVNAASWLLTPLMFHIRASYRLLSPSFHDIWAFHSRDTIWPWQFKVKGQRSKSKVP